MKKLIAIAVVFALAVGAVFAVDLSADVDAFVKVFEGKSKLDAPWDPTDSTKVKASGGFDAVRLSGSGELADGKFGGHIRINAAGGASGLGLAWWKPIDQFKLSIGQSNAKGGMGWGKEGNSGWGFNQKAYGTKVASGEGNIWGGGYLEEYVGTPSVLVKPLSLHYRYAFAEDADDDKLGLYMEITPMDMLAINFGFKGFSSHAWDPITGTVVSTTQWGKGLFQENFVFQVDLKFAFGNIALTYRDDSVFIYFGGSFGAINLDVGLSVPGLIGPVAAPGTPHSLDTIYFGAALKFTSGAFGIKFRTAEGIPLKSSQSFKVLFDVLPYFAINDNFSVFVNMGMGMEFASSYSLSGVSYVGGLKKLAWQFNPYIRIGGEWGPSFYAGIQIQQDNVKGSGMHDAIKFALPIGITVGF